MENCELSVIIPCLNEEKTIGPCVQQAHSFFARHGVNGEVLVADNASQDGSSAVAKAAGARVIKVSKQGYGAAVMGGVQSARGRFLIMADGDGSCDLSDLGGFLDHLRDGADLVVGNRFAGGIRPRAMPWIHRYVGIPALTSLAQLLFRAGVHDIHCGFRGFSRSAINRIDPQTTGMEFASEMVVKAALNNLRIEEVPVVLYPDQRGRPSHLRRWRDGWRHLRFLLLCSPLGLFLVPGTVLIAIASLGMARALAVPAPTPNHLTMLAICAVSILTGSQLFFFGVITRIYSAAERFRPLSKPFYQLFRFITLEVGLAGGGALLITGLVWGVALYFRSGDIEPLILLKWSIPPLVCVGLGIQTIFVSFLVSMLGMGRQGAVPFSPADI